MNGTVGGLQSSLTRIATELAVDVGYGLLWAALIVAIVLFSGAASQFAYVDF